MALLELLGLGVITYIFNESRKNAIEERKRRNTRCRFDDIITKEYFERNVKSVCNSVKRIEEVKIDGPIIKCSVRSNSKLSLWKFRIDFNDYGEITGEYWINSENDDSIIPKHVAERVQSIILEKSNFIETKHDEYRDGSRNRKKTCKYCKEKLASDSVFCKKCGKKQDSFFFQFVPIKLLAILKSKRLKWIFLAIIIFGLSLLAINENNKDLHLGEVKTPLGSSIQKGKNFNDVIKEFEKNGFTNIKLEKSDTLIIGWLKKDGEVKHVSVGGNIDYTTDKLYPEDIEVIITYYTFSNNDKGKDNDTN